MFVYKLVNMYMNFTDDKGEESEDSLPCMGMEQTEE